MTDVYSVKVSISNIWVVTSDLNMWSNLKVPCIVFKPSDFKPGRLVLTAVSICYVNRCILLSFMMSKVGHEACVHDAMNHCWQIARFKIAIFLQLYILPPGQCYAPQIIFQAVQSSLLDHGSELGEQEDPAEIINLLLNDMHLHSERGNLPHDAWPVWMRTGSSRDFFDSLIRSAKADH